MRRLPVYFLLDTSGSMYGEPIQALNNAINGMIHGLNTDPQAIETVWISVITFGMNVEELIPLTELPSLKLPEITCPKSGPTFTGKALELLREKVESDVRKSTADQKGDWRPLLFVFTDGKPSDIAVYNEVVPKIKSLGFAAIVGCAAGNLADESQLRALTDTVVHLEAADSATLSQFFEWVSETIKSDMNTDSSISTGSDTLPPPPSEVNIVI